MIESRRGHLVLGAGLALVGVAMSAAAYRVGRPEGTLPLVYWGILPGAPFVLLGGLSLVPGFSLRSLVGAAVGGLIAVAVPYGLLWYSSATYSGGGANIGLGLLLFFLPAYLPLAMLLGAVVGQLVTWLRSRQNASLS